METTEQLLFSNYFGIVTNKKVTLNYKSGPENIPTDKITSISFKHKRSQFFFIGSLFVTVSGLLFMIFNITMLGGFEVLILGVLILFMALGTIANYIGHHTIEVSIGGQDRKPLKVEMSKTKEGRAFYDAVAKVVFK